jgi:hypothetical protein
VQYHAGLVVHLDPPRRNIIRSSHLGHLRVCLRPASACTCDRHRHIHRTLCWGHPTSQPLTPHGSTL